MVLFNTYIKVPPCRIPTPIGILLAQCDEFFGEALSFLGFWPGGLDGFVFEEGGYKIAKEGFAMGGFTGEVPVFDVTTCHGGECRGLRR